MPLRHCSHNAEPEEEGQAGAKEDKEDGEKQSSAQHESMQIEEVLLQEGSSAQQHTGSSSQQGDSVGVMGAMMGAAKSLFGGGKHDQEVCFPLPTALTAVCIQDLQIGFAKAACQQVIAHSGI